MEKLSFFSQKLGEDLRLSGAGNGIALNVASVFTADDWTNGGWNNYSDNWLNSGWNNYSSGWTNSGWNNYSSGWTNSGWNNYSSGWTNSGWNNYSDSSGGK